MGSFAAPPNRVREPWPARGAGHGHGNFSSLRGCGRTAPCRPEAAGRTPAAREAGAGR